jgi:hypothetical protein
VIKDGKEAFALKEFVLLASKECALHLKSVNAFMDTKVQIVALQSPILLASMALQTALTPVSAKQGGQVKSVMFLSVPLVVATDTVSMPTPVNANQVIIPVLPPLHAILSSPECLTSTAFHSQTPPQHPQYATNATQDSTYHPLNHAVRLMCGYYINIVSCLD